MPAQIGSPKCAKVKIFLIPKRYINSFMTANNCYIITELYNSGDLSKLLKEKVRFT